MWQCFTYCSKYAIDRCIFILWKIINFDIFPFQLLPPLHEFNANKIIFALIDLRQNTISQLAYNTCCLYSFWRSMLVWAAFYRSSSRVANSHRLMVWQCPLPIQHRGSIAWEISHVQSTIWKLMVVVVLFLKILFLF